MGIDSLALDLLGVLLLIIAGFGVLLISSGVGIPRTAEQPAQEAEEEVQA